MAGYTKTKFIGIRYREHTTRKHGVGADRYFFIRYKIDGKDKEEGAGWGSEGMTAEKAFKLLSAIRDNIRVGDGPKSLAEMREANALKEKTAKEKQRAKAKTEMSFAVFLRDEYWPYAQKTRTKRTYDSERNAADKWLLPALGDLPFSKIDEFKVEALIAHIQKAGRTAGTIAKITGLLSQVWNRAVARGVIRGDCPTKRVKRPKQDNKRVRFLSEDEAKNLLAALALRSMDVHDEALLALFAGLRAGEIHKLTWGDVDFSTGTMFIRDAKNGTSRHAFLNAEIHSMLLRRQKEQAKADYVFPAEGGKLREWVSDTFARTVAALGMNEGVTDARQKVVFHTLRHTFASWLVMRGVPLYDVAKLMGHNTIIMTQRYAHLAPDRLRASAAGLSGILDKKSATVLPFQERTQGARA